MKQCSRCGETKPMDHFYRHPKMADGHVGKCKECTKAGVRLNRASKLDYYREYDAARAMTETRIASRKRYNATVAGRSARALAIRAYRTNNPGRSAAYSSVKRAIKNGLLRRQSCESCGSPRTQAHHTDYSKPLDVRWLCARHHAQVHGRALEAV